MLIDRYGREIRSLRVSITKRCNLDCIYCHNDGQPLEGKEELSVEAMTKICRVFNRLGVKKMKISGGEPLIREDCVEMISSLKGFDEISMTTNGVFLAEKAQDLKEAGLDRLNISIDTLKGERYSKITRSSPSILLKVMEGLKEAVEADLTPVKINMVLLEINRDEIGDFVDYIRKNALQDKVVLQLIELIDLNGSFPNKVNTNEIEGFLTKNAKFIGTRRTQNRRKYLYRGVEIETVKPVDNTAFCAACSRLRLTADGFLKPCLLRNDNLVKIRGGSSEEEIERCIKEALRRREPYYKGNKGR